MPALHRALCSIVEGISFTIQHSGHPVRGLVLSDTLEAAFGAASDGTAWLRCFDQNEAAIVGAAYLLLQDDPLLDPVIVHARDLAPADAAVVAGPTRTAPV